MAKYSTSGRHYDYFLDAVYDKLKELGGDRLKAGRQMYEITPEEEDGKYILYHGGAAPIAGGKFDPNNYMTYLSTIPSYSRHYSLQSPKRKEERGLVKEEPGHLYRVKIPKESLSKLMPGAQFDIEDVESDDPMRAWHYIEDAIQYVMPHMTNKYETAYPEDEYSLEEITDPSLLKLYKKQAKDMSDEVIRAKVKDKIIKSADTPRWT